MEETPEAAEEKIETEETEVNVIGIIPAHEKDFDKIEIENITPKEIYVKLDGDRLKGSIVDTIGTVMLFSPNQSGPDASVIGLCEKQVKLEHFVNVPKSELAKPFIPMEALVQKSS